MSVEALITSHLDLWTGATIKKSTAGRGSNGQISLIGIAKLRRLILGLAVRGNLVQQNPDNEPASALLQKIKNHRSELIKAGAIKKPKTLSEVSVEEQYFPLPENWEWVRLGTLFDSIISGGTPSKRNPAFWGGEIPWASVKDLGKSKYLDTTQDHITEAGLQAGSKLAATGDVLICTRMGLGKVAICSRPIAINQDLKAVKVSPKTALDYFFLAYTTLDITGTGTTVSGITQEKLLNYVIGLPPIEEQHRIVQKVDELMALCDRLEQQTSDQIAAHDTLVDTLLSTLTQSQNATELAENWTRLAAHFDTLFTTEQSIDKLKQTILQLAVMGRLVEQDAGDEPVPKLLEELAQKKNALVDSGAVRKPKKLPAAEAHEVPFRIPDSWVLARWNDVTDWMTYGFTRPMPHIEDGPRILTAKNVQDGYIDSTECHQTSEASFQELNPKDRPEKGDILLTKDGSIGRAAVVEEEGRFCINQSVAVLWLRSCNLNKRYLILAIRSPWSQQMIWDAAAGAAIKHLSITNFVKFPLPIPPLEEQGRIVQKADELMALCDQLKKRLNQASKTRCQLAETIVESALQ